MTTIAAWEPAGRTKISGILPRYTENKSLTLQ